MSKLSKRSKFADPSDLSLFTFAPTDPTFQNTTMTPIRPRENYEAGGGLKFEISASNEQNIKPSGIYLSYGIQYRVGADAITNENTAGPINTPGYSHFQSLSVSLNGRVITNNPMFAYTSHLTTLLTYGGDAKSSHLSSLLYAKDTPGAMDAYQDNTNRGLTARRTYFENGRTAWFYVRLHSDFFNVDRVLPTNMKMEITLQIADPRFAIMAPDVQIQGVAAAGGNPAVPEQRANFTIRIVNPVLWVPMVRLMPDVLIGQLNGLERGNAEYWMTRTVMRNLTIAQGLSEQSFHMSFGNQIPKRIIYGLVHNAAYTGSYQRNPFNFQHFNLNHTCIYVNGQMNPIVPFTPDYRTGDGENERNWIREYINLFDAMGIKYANKGLDIFRDEFPNGYCLYAYDLTPNQGASDPTHVNLIKDGEVRIEFKFREAAAHAISCIVLAEFDTLVEVDIDRNVYISWAGS